MNQEKYNLTEGNILSKLLLIALPAIGTQIVTMTYNLADMFWLGRLSSDAVAASGTAGMYLWLIMAFMLFGSRGAEIGVSQNIGRGDKKTAQEIAEASSFLALALGLLVGAVLFVFKNPLVGFFGLQEKQVSDMATSYLGIIALGVPFNFLASALSGIFNGSGNSQVPFRINVIALLINMVLDPIFIFNLEMGISGAAAATVIAQISAGVLMIFAIKKSASRPFEKFAVWRNPNFTHIKKIFIQVMPMSVESFLFCFMSMLITRIIALWGADALAAQKIGSQIESLSWLVAGGFSSAFTAYIGQNYGAKKWHRLNEGFKISSIAMLLYGLFVTIFIFFGGKYVMAVFLPDNQNALEIGEVFLKFLAVCQTLACLEGIAAGAYRGMGQTLKPSIASIVSNLSRLIAAYFLSKTSLGLNGVWLSISVGASVRGLWIYLWYVYDNKKSMAH